MHSQRAGLVPWETMAMKFLAVNERLLSGSLESPHDEQDFSAGLFPKTG